MRKRNRIYARVPPEERFWKFVNKTDNCWLWTGATRDFGYGVINMGGKYGKTERAHRLSWTIHFGPIQAGLFVCHRCDNPLCVRPDHLFLGTHRDNMADCQTKGRYDRVKRPKRERHGMAKLTEGDIANIRREHALFKPYLRELAAKYDVSLQQIHRIVKGKSWG